MCAWDVTKPTSGTNIVDIPIIHGDNWYAFEQAFSDEHYGFSSALSGSHKPGLTGVVSAGPTSAVSAISNPTSGALVWDETLGLGKIYITGWEQVNMLPLSRVSVCITADQTVPVSADINNPEAVHFIDSVVSLEGRDTLSEYNNTTYTFTPLADGWYLFFGKLNISASAGTEISSNISVRSSADSEQYTSGNFFGFALSTDAYDIYSNAVLYLEAGQQIRVYIYHNSSSTIILEGGSSNTFLKIHRIS